MINVYTVQVTVKVAADTEREAYHFIYEALRHAKKAEIVYVDAEVIETTPEETDEEPPRGRRLTREEQLEGLADRGCDTWEEYRGER